MGLLGKPLGVFSIEESDKYVGAFFSKDDVKTILEVGVATLLLLSYYILDKKYLIFEVLRC